MHVPVSAPTLRELMQELDGPRLAELLPLSGDSREYLHWDTVLHLDPPEGLSRREWWLSLKLGRVMARKQVPLRHLHSSLFYFTTPDPVLRRLHLLDQQLAGRIAMAESITSEGLRDKYLVTSLMEEAITSSQLEGAVTSRPVAKEMLRSGRPPRDRSELMIANNFAAMRRVREVLDQPLTPELVCQLHRIVTVGTLDDPTSAGRLEQPGEPRVRVWGHGDQLLHTPPPAQELPQRLAALCAFANAETDQGFVHPIIRAVVLHFWIGYDHYFADGNGRTARAVFYWSMLRQGYWLAEFLTISSVLRQAPIAYAQSFLYAETDDNDLTYFVIAQLDVLLRAVVSLQEYLQRKVAETARVEGLLGGDSGINHRQRVLLSKALRDTHSVYTIAGHQSAHRVVYQTARADLLSLAERGLLLRERKGHAFVFMVPTDLHDRLRHNY